MGSHRIVIDPPDFSDRDDILIVDFLNFGLTSLVVFCRVGACLLVAPAIASSRVPVPLRLYIGLSVAALITPSVTLHGSESFATISGLTITILSETFIGLLFGFSVRLIFLALEVIGELISMCVGLSNNFGVALDGADPSPIVTSFLSLLVLNLILILDVHHKLIEGIADTYRAIPIGSKFSFRSSLKDLVDMITHAFLCVIRIAYPFIFFSLLINFGFGLINKLIPQFPAFFISLPFVIYGGLLILYITIVPASSFFMSSVFDVFSRM